MSEIGINMYSEGIQFVYQDDEQIIDDQELAGNEMMYTNGTRAILVQGTDGQFFIPANGKFIINEEGNILIDEDQLHEQVLPEHTDFSHLAEGETETMEVEYSTSMFADDSNQQVIYYMDKMGEELADESLRDTFVEADVLKRFEVGNSGIEIEALYASTEEDVNGKQLSIAEDADVASGSYQYAILKDGKLHIQTYDGTDSLDILGVVDGAEDTILQQPAQDDDDNSLLVSDVAMLQSKAVSEPPRPEIVDISKITGRNLITGQTVTLDSYFDKLQRKICDPDMTEVKCEPSDECESPTDFVNRKLVLGKTTKGKKLVGRILKIQKCSDLEENHVERESIPDVRTDSDDPPSDSVDSTETPVESKPGILIKKHVISRCKFDYISKMLAGLMEMDSVQKKLSGKRILVKLIEKCHRRDEERADGDAAFKKNVSYLYGCMRSSIVWDDDSVATEKWSFELVGEDGKLMNGEEVVESTEDENTYTEMTSLTLIITTDKFGKRTTRVNLSPYNWENHCHLCGKTFKTSAHYKKHVGSQHARATACKQCWKQFPDQTALQKHKRSCRASAAMWYECEVCNRKFGAQGSLKRHMSVHDPTLRHLQCGVCLQRFTDQSSLRKHLLIHTGIKAYRCWTCSRSFVNLGDLNFHMRIHNPVKQYVCEVCGREFSRHSNLQRHAEIHKGSGALYKCKICSCSYNFISSLTRHVVQNHINKGWDEDKAEEKD